MQIVLVAGETSGDHLGAGLMQALRASFPDAEFFGVGGPRMQEAGQTQWFDADELAVMGLVEVLRHLPRLLRRRRQVIAQTSAIQPDVYIGIDAPDFNLPIERKLKARGVRTVHYVSPSIWAWRQGRAKSIGQCADLVLCLFPFEPPLYHIHGIKAEFVGHPLADQFPMQPAPLFARSALGLPMSGPVLALLPGSRASEVSRLAKDFMDAAKIARAQVSKLMVIAPMANARVAAIFAGLRDSDHQLITVDGQAQLVLQACDAVIVASGTAALEAALARKPMVVAYRVSPATYWLAKQLKLLKTDYFSLPNALAGQFFVPELAQNAVTPERLAALIIPKLQGQESPETAEKYLDIHLALKQNASESAAAAIATLLGQTP